jgi:hypothetical protein
MKHFAEKIRSLISSKKNLSENTETTPFDFVKSRKGMLKELIISKQSGTVVGVYSKVLGEGMILTGVQEIDSSGKSEIIVFNRYDISGHILTRTHVALDEIHMVCPFNKPYYSPVLSNNKVGAKAIL